MRTMRVSRSTRQPPSLRMSSASSASTQTPVRSSDLSEAEVDVVELSLREQVQAEPPELGRPACRFRFTRSTSADRRCVTAGEAAGGAKGDKSPHPTGVVAGALRRSQGSRVWVGRGRVKRHRRARPTSPSNPSRTARGAREVRPSCAPRPRGHPDLAAPPDLWIWAAAPRLETQDINGATRESGSSAEEPFQGDSTRRWEHAPIRHAHAHPQGSARIGLRGRRRPADYRLRR